MVRMAEHGKFQPGEPAKNSGTDAGTDHVHAGNCRDYENRGELQRERRPVKNIGSVGGDSGGEGGGEAGIENEQAHPAVEKCGTRAVGFMEIHVGATGTGKTAGQFAETEGAAESHSRDSEPDDEQPEWRAEGFGHAGGREENSHGDGFAGDGCRGGTETELAAEVIGVECGRLVSFFHVRDAPAGFE